ncbi:hypothetical protein P4S63_04485 [Pseudoalteromonas sp. B193]
MGDGFDVVEQKGSEHRDELTLKVLHQIMQVVYLRVFRQGKILLLLLR